MEWRVYLTTVVRQQTKMKLNIYIIISLLFISACNTTENTRKTLRDIDIITDKKATDQVFVKPKSKADIRKAYADYLQYASQDDKSRLDAINRLAELEFELSNKIENEQSAIKNKNEISDDLFNQRLNKTIELLSTSLKDYPNAKGNDKVLYQLAKAYDHNGDPANSEKSLSFLVKKYPKSPYYSESKFRLAEMYFSRKDYAKAENTYTDVIGSEKNNIFYEKALFKRGWSRFKQEYYLEAVDDLLAAVEFHNFDDFNKLDESQKEQFNEYFRAIGLSFSYEGGVEPLNIYFENNQTSRHVYYSYLNVSNIYLKQERFTDAVKTLKYFISQNKNSEKIPETYLKIISTWKKAGFAKNAITEIDTLYNNFNPDSKYWTTKKTNSKTYKDVSAGIKENILLAASHFHKQFHEKHNKNDFTQAKKWYQRYLSHFKNHANKDDIYHDYASLLATAGQYQDALHNYELAAYDGEIILNKKSAYATVLLTDKIYKTSNSQDIKSQAFKKHISYVSLYAQLYPGDKQSPNIVLHAAERAYENKQYSKTINISSSLGTSVSPGLLVKANTLKAHAFFNLEQYEDAESLYSQLVNNNSISKTSREKLVDRLALSIYKQAEKSAKNNDTNSAINHYVRIINITPTSQVAATGLYDGIALAMTHNYWNIAIEKIKLFQQAFPKHQYANDVTKKLSIAYLKSNQGIKAAQAFEKISGFEKNSEVKIAALWQAAELYESKNDIPAAIRAYENYAKNYKKPYPQFMEAMNKVSELYAKSGNDKMAKYWYKEIIKHDNRAANKSKNDRTRYITSYASLSLAKQEHGLFNQQQLVLPLKLSLRQKKHTMQKAVQYYGHASKQGIADTATESTHAIAEIYKSFSESLLSSERPKGLSKEESEQYVILLEDKAFPFEDKAIEFHEANMSHIKDGVYNKWVKLSHQKLKQLFPARYKRTAKLDGYINVLH